MEHEFRYYIGEERSYVAEKEGFSESIFKYQYEQSMKLVNEYLLAISRIGQVDAGNQDSPNIIAFCGDRGEGKTSCMLSVRNIMDYCCKRVIPLSEEALNAKGIFSDWWKAKTIKETSIDFLPIIDPSFFDEVHNIPELLLGQMYCSFLKWNEEHYDCDAMQRNKVMKLFQEVKKNLLYLEKKKEDLYDALEEVQALAAGVTLKKKISDLMEAYLKLLGKDKLLICIDDLDLNTQGAYTMCEHIRKYLCNPYCLVLVSVNLIQLQSVIANEISHSLNNKDKVGFELTASKYISKLFPLTCRVNMPKTYDLCGWKLRVFEKRQEATPKYEFETVKDGVLRLIFKRTGFLFYNSKGGTSPIIPNNLRDLMHLLALLLDLNKIDSYEQRLANQERFKSYFFKSWIKILSKKNQEIVLQIIEIGNDGELNKYVVSKLSDFLGKEIKEEILTKQIIAAENYAYNVSVGDVFYLLTKLSHTTYDLDLLNLLFFIRSYYSIRMYEAYNQITEGGIPIYLREDNDADKYHIYKQDAWFKQTNPLQTLVGGRYFTYAAGEFLPKGNIARDMTIVLGSTKTKENGLARLIKYSEFFKRIIDEYSHQEHEADEEEPKNISIAKARFQLAEFLALTTITSIEEKKSNNESNFFDRTSPAPYYLTQYNKEMGYYVFDVMAIFSSLTNPQYAYNRFSSIAPLFEMAKESEWSLLRQMMKKARGRDLYEEEKCMHDLLSCAVIRNGEVLDAICENIKKKRLSSYGTSKDAGILAKFYDSLTKTDMATYANEQTNEPYKLEFTFLEPVVSLLKSKWISEVCKISEDETIPTFDDIFSGWRNLGDDAGLVMELLDIAMEKNKSRMGSVIKQNLLRKKGDLYNSYSHWDEQFEDNKRYGEDRAKRIFLSILEEIKRRHDSTETEQNNLPQEFTDLNEDVVATTTANGEATESPVDGHDEE